MKFEDIHESKPVRIIIASICVVIIVLSILHIGIIIGENKARFAMQFGNNFENNFSGQIDSPEKFFKENLPSGHGVVGKIISISSSEIIVNGPDNLEKIVTVNEKTLVRQFQENISITKLKIGDFIVVLGNPDDQGKVEAKLIRIMPSPNTAAATSTKSQ